MNPDPHDVLPDPHPTEARPILILQRILPPYRIAFFQALAQSPELAPTLAYGRASQGSALESSLSPPEILTVPVRNRYWGKNERVIWQSGGLPLLRPDRCDTVIAEFSPRILSNVLACLAARRRGLKFIWWGHGFRPRSGHAAKLVYLWLAARADAVIFYTPEGAQGLIARGMPREKAFVAWNSLDTEAIARLARDFLPEQRPRILCVGRLIPQKKVDLLLRGFALACPNLPPQARLTIIGDGPEQGALKSLAARLGIADQVEFVESLYDQPRLAPYFNTACFSVSAGYVGLSAIHSLAYGVPLVVADAEPHSPEIAAVEDGVNAVFFRSDHAAGLAARMTDLFRSPDHLRQMSEAARTGAVRKFSLDAMVRAFEQAVRYAHESP